MPEGTPAGSFTSHLGVAPVQRQHGACRVGQPLAAGCELLDGGGSQGDAFPSLPVYLAVEKALSPLPAAGAILLAPNLVLGCEGLGRMHRRRGTPLAALTQAAGRTAPILGEY